MIACALVDIVAHGEEGNILAVRQTVRSGVVSVAEVHRVASVEDAIAEDTSRDGALVPVAVDSDWVLLEVVMRDEDTGPKNGVCWSLLGVASFR